MEKKHTQCVVVGSGVIGLCCAAMLAHKAYTVRVLGSAVVKHDARQYGRVYAINLCAQGLLETIGVWDALLATARVQAYTDMLVFDRVQSNASPIHFASTDLGLPALGYIVEDTLLRSALHRYLHDCPTAELSLPSKLEDFQYVDQTMQIKLNDRQTMTSNLLLGADGAHSKVREIMKVNNQTVAYKQTAFCATLHLGKSHGDTCRQWFYSDSILALLPLPDKQVSMVWSCDLSLASSLEDSLASSPLAFQDLLNERLSSEQFEVLSMSAVHSFPLGGAIVDTYAQPGVVLMGDAAHRVHPLAGQGANMGFADIECLMKSLQQSQSRKAEGEIIWADLRRYERAVKGRNWATKVFLEQLQGFMTNRRVPVNGLRQIGMKYTNNCLPLKAYLTRQALGI